MTLAAPQPLEYPQPHRFTREEYYQMADSGILQDRRVELIHGELVDMAPQKNPHFLAISRAGRTLAAAFGASVWVRQQGPLHLGGASAPEPDLAVVSGPMESYNDHPTDALFVVEVSDATLRFDRGKKASLYASGGIADYWIVNLPGQCVEVFREPVPDSGAPFGFRYQAVKTFRPGDSIAPLACPAAPVAVADLLP